MITRNELQQLHDNLEQTIKLKLREEGESYDGYGQDLIALSHYKEQLED